MARCVCEEPEDEEAEVGTGSLGCAVADTAHAGNEAADRRGDLRLDAGNRAWSPLHPGLGPLLRTLRLFLEAVGGPPSLAGHDLALFAPEPSSRSRSFFRSRVISSTGWS